MTLIITPIYAAALGLILLVLWTNVVRTRARTHIGIGHGDSVALHERIRQHGNFAEWAPLSLILLALAELSGLGPMWLHLAGALMVLGRLLHPFGMSAERPAHPLRIISNSANFIAVAILIVALGRAALGV